MYSLIAIIIYHCDPIISIIAKALNVRAISFALSGKVSNGEISSTSSRWRWGYFSRDEPLNNKELWSNHQQHWCYWKIYRLVFDESYTNQNVYFCCAPSIYMSIRVTWLLFISTIRYQTRSVNTISNLAKSSVPRWIIVAMEPAVSSPFRVVTLISVTKWLNTSSIIDNKFTTILTSTCNHPG